MMIGRRTLAVLGLAVLSLSSTRIGWAQTPVVVFPPFDPAACVAKPQHLLILDMKSGWWSGDGADFHNLLLPRIVKDCPMIDVEYYFLQFVDQEPLPPGVPAPPGFQIGLLGILSFYPQRPGIGNDQFWVEANFPNRPWNEYAQVWLLSGSNQDGSDVPTTSEFFVNLLTKLSTTTAVAPSTFAPSVFVGTGIGNNDHGNRVLASFQFPELFQTHLELIDTPNVTDGTQVETRSRLRPGTDLTNHAVFEGVEGIADTVSIAQTDYTTDFLPTANNPFQIVGRNGLGEPSIAVRDTETRRFVIDAGMQRFYSLFSPTEAGTYRYLQNIIKYLAR